MTEIIRLLCKSKIINFSLFYRFHKSAAVVVFLSTDLMLIRAIK